jgi:hypothetical protein
MSPASELSLSRLAASWASVLTSLLQARLEAGYLLLGGGGRGSRGLRLLLLALLLRDLLCQRPRGLAGGPSAAGHAAAHALADESAAVVQHHGLIRAIRAGHVARRGEAAERGTIRGVAPEHSPARSLISSLHSDWSPGLTAIWASCCCA